MIDRVDRVRPRGPSERERMRRSPRPVSLGPPRDDTKLNIFVFTFVIASVISQPIEKCYKFLLSTCLHDHQVTKIEHLIFPLLPYSSSLSSFVLYSSSTWSSPQSTSSPFQSTAVHRQCQGHARLVDICPSAGLQSHRIHSSLHEQEYTSQYYSSSNWSTFRCGDLCGMTKSFTDGSSHRPIFVSRGPSLSSVAADQGRHSYRDILRQMNGWKRRIYCDAWCLACGCGAWSRILWVD